ncbi:hypothetical protein J3459_010455 [Metarhizium acridum]|nr:hypothetical protein J3459_010455 [Metarhizium acridum]
MKGSKSAYGSNLTAVDFTVVYEPASLGVESTEDTSSVQLLFLFRHISPARSRELQGSHSNALMIRKGINTKTRNHRREFPLRGDHVAASRRMGLAAEHVYE